MDSIVAISAIMSICSCLYHLLAMICAFIFFNRKQTSDNNGPWPKVACLKPLCGYDRETRQNLESFICQDYPHYEVIFGVKDRDDPAYPIAVDVCKDHPDRNVKVVVGEKGRGANRKVRNLRNIYDHVSPDALILVLSDSDTRVSRDYIRHMVKPLRNDPEIGAVTSIYRIEKIESSGDMIEALAVETTFVPGVLLTNCFSDLQFAFGASIAVDRQAFSRIGGFEAIEDYLADDYKIGNLIYRGNPAQSESKKFQALKNTERSSVERGKVSGKRIVLSSYVVPIIPPGEGMFSALNHIVRWNRTIRICKPVGYFLSVACHSCFWAMACFVAAGGGLIGWTTLTATCFIRVITATAFVALIRSESGILKTLLTPIWDIVSVILWGVGLMGNTVTWRGTRYKILGGGKLKEI